MVKKDIKEEANAYIKKSKEISNQAKEIIDIEKTEEKRKDYLNLVSHKSSPIATFKNLNFIIRLHYR